MRPDVFVSLSGALTFGVPLALAIRELFVLRRGNEGPGWSPERAPDPVPPPAGPSGSQLPECLPAPFRIVQQEQPRTVVRELELV